MAEKTKEGLKFFTDIVFKWGYFVLISIGLYLHKEFATKDDYNEMDKRVNLLIERQHHDEIQDKEIGELDKRVRELELRRVAGGNYYNQAYPEK